MIAQMVATILHVPLSLLLFRASLINEYQGVRSGHDSHKLQLAGHHHDLLQLLIADPSSARKSKPLKFQRLVWISCHFITLYVYHLLWVVGLWNFDRNFRPNLHWSTSGANHCDLRMRHSVWDSTGLPRGDLCRHRQLHRGRKRAPSQKIHANHYVDISGHRAHTANVNLFSEKMRLLSFTQMSQVCKQWPRLSSR